MKRVTIAGVVAGGASPETSARIDHLPPNAHAESHVRYHQQMSSASPVIEDIRRYRTEMPEDRVREICGALDREYGSPRHGNKDDPLDEIVFIILSTRTQERSFNATFERLKEAFPSWDRVRPEQLAEIEEILQPGGLGRLKASQIVQIVEAVRERFGSATLDPLRSMPADDVEAFLTSLPGVAKKVAKCVEMYSLHLPVLPVDVHVHRVAGRLGFPVKKRPDTSQDIIEAAVPPELRHGFHVNAVAHGRATCLPRSPRCSSCCISQWCSYYAHHRRDLG